MSRSVECAVLAAREAMAMAAQAASAAPIRDRIGIYTGSGQTGLEPSEFFAALETGRSRR